jgi:hypothetical protein
MPAFGRVRVGVGVGCGFLAAGLILQFFEWLVPGTVEQSLFSVGLAAAASAIACA